MASVFRNIALIIVSSLFAFVCSEIVFRAWVYNKQRNEVLDFERIERDIRPKAQTHEVTLGEIIQPTSNPRLIYELRPNMKVRFMGAFVQTNRFGFRGSEYNMNKQEDVLRIVGIGDSVMFGWGVEHEASYFSKLSEVLNLRTPNCPWEVVNTAVPGYNTTMEVESLIVKGLNFLPDLVIIQYVGNDLMLPNFIRRDYWNFKRSYLLYFLYDRLRGRANVRAYLDYAPPARDGIGFESDPSLVPSEYKEMVGIASYRSAMRKLHDLAEENHFGVLVFTQFRFPVHIKRVLDEVKMEYLEGAPAFAHYMTQHGIKKYLGSTLSISAEDPHPSSTAHYLQADFLAKHLQERIFSDAPQSQEVVCSDIRQKLRTLDH